MSTNDSLIIGAIDQTQKLNVTTVPLGEMPRRIAYQPETKSLCVLTSNITTTPSGEELSSCFAKLVDSVTYEILDSVPLQQYEEATSISSVRFTDDPQLYYVVGTGFAPPSERMTFLIKKSTDSFFQLNL